MLNHLSHQIRYLGRALKLYPRLDDNDVLFARKGGLRAVNMRNFLPNDSPNVIYKFDKYPQGHPNSKVINMPRDKLTGMIVHRRFQIDIYTILPIEKEANDIMQTDIMRQHEKMEQKISRLQRDLERANARVIIDTPIPSEGHDGMPYTENEGHQSSSPQTGQYSYVKFYKHPKYRSIRF